MNCAVLVGPIELSESNQVLFSQSRLQEKYSLVALATCFCVLMQGWYSVGQYSDWQQTYIKYSRGTNVDFHLVFVLGKIDNA